MSFSPPAIHREWWAITESCSGLTGSFDAVSWYSVPGTSLPRGALGLWYKNGNRIVVAEYARSWGDLVRHEMLHALDRGPGHPRSLFLRQCGGIVSCAEECEEDGPAGAPPAGAEVVVPESLHVNVDVWPSAPSSATVDGHFMMTITVRNPAARAVIVELPPSGDAGPSGSFSYRIQGGGGTRHYDERAWTPEVTWFEAGESKKFIFDFSIGSDGTRYRLPPGTYRFNGAYGDSWAPSSPTVTVAP